MGFAEKQHQFPLKARTDFGVKPVRQNPFFFLRVIFSLLGLGEFGQDGENSEANVFRKKNNRRNARLQRGQNRHPNRG
jgi:hypothetical protein